MVVRRILVVDNTDELSEADINGADAILPSKMSDEETLMTFRLVAHGERIVPSSMAIRLREPPPTVLPRTRPLLSPREGQIVKLLESGASNKLIAREIGITEATVKVHLKSIQRKLGLANRTQVAMWSLQNALPEAAD
jgi:two-component system nitrate/nitrite response regulator NarL